MNLRLKLTLSFSGLVILMTIGSLYYLNSFLLDYLVERTTKNFQIFSELSEGSYYAFIDRLKTRTVDWSSDAYIKITVEKIITSSGKERDQLVSELNTYLATQKIHYDSTVLMVEILNKDGIVISSSRPERLGSDEKKEEIEFGATRFSEALQSNFGESFSTPIIYESDEYDKPMTHVVTRVFSTQKDATGKFIPLDAVLLIHFVDTGKLGEILTGKFQISKGALSGQILYETYASAEIYIVNNKKLMITPSRLVPDSVLKTKVDTEPVNLCLNQERELSGEYLNYAGAEVIGAAMCLDGGREVLIIEARKDEILAPFKNLQKQIIFSAISIIFAGLIIIFLLSSALLRNLMNIIKTAQEVAKNNLGARTNVKSSDEVGYLANIFNQMLENTEKSQNELKDTETKLKKTNTALEQYIAERNEKLAELEKFHKLTVNRELQMIQLKKEIELLKNKPDTTK